MAQDSEKKSKSLVSITVGVTLLLQIVGLASSKNHYSEIENLTPSQRKTLDSFKISVSPVLPHDYMKEDIYLFRFLQFNNFNIPKSEKHLKEALKWRQQNNVDELIENPPDYFDALQKDFPIFTDGFDKEDRPTAAAGYLKNVTLHMQVNCIERANVRIREQQAKGLNVTQWVAILNMDGFSVTEQVCPSCLPLLVNLAGGNDRYSPNSAGGFWLINTPEHFSVLFRYVRPVMSPGARGAMKVFTADASKWKPFLEKHVDFNEISDWYGGAKDHRQ